MATKTDPIELMYRYLAAVGTYHNSKEQMAYSGATLYLAGALAVFVGHDFWRGKSPYYIAVLIAFLLLISALSFYFVWWQLQMRRFAAAEYTALSNLLNSWLTKDPHDLDIDPNYGSNSEDWPKCLADEMRRTHSAPDNWLPFVFPLGTMALATAAALSRVMGI
jgi:hypothetical protein